MSEKVYLFYPKSTRDLRFQYPELAKEKAFENLSPLEVLFCWYHSNPTSPYFNMKNETERIKISIEKSFGDKMADNIRTNYLSNKIPDRVRIGMKRMSEYVPDIRFEARQLAIQQLNHLKSMANVTDEDFYIVDANGKKTIDWNARKAYVSVSVDIQKALPDLIKQVEQGFGIVEINDPNEEEGDTTSELREFHKEKHS